MPTAASSPARHLFSPLTLRSITLRNRIGVSPMCQYSARDGLWNDWHLVHLGARAVGGAGLIIAEATAVKPEGRITPGDTGLWNDAQIEPLARVARFVHAHGAVLGAQLAHAGRKASTPEPWSALPRGTLPASAGGWQPLGPSAMEFDAKYAVPRELTRADLDAVVEAFAQAAMRALAAGVKLVEVHAAHGYLLHSFHSPLSNQRRDEFGGSHENRTRLTRMVVRAVRRVWPDRLPLSVRLSCTDWLEGGWTLEESIQLAAQLKGEGVDIIDCSSGGGYSGQTVKSMGEPLFQVPFAEAIRREAGIATAAVGLITTPRQAQAIIEEGKADLVLLARQSLREPYWPMRALRELRAAGVEVGGATMFPPQVAYWVQDG